MITTATATTNPKTTKATPYTFLVVFTVGQQSAEQLHDQPCIRDEARSWLESLNAPSKA